MPDNDGSAVRNGNRWSFLLILTPLLVAGFGAWTGWQSSSANSRVQQLHDALTQTQAFTEQLNKSVDALSGSNATKAKLAFLSLYPFAQNGSEKYILISIATDAKHPELVEPVGDLLNDIPESDLRKYPSLAAAEDRLRAILDLQGRKKVSDSAAGNSATTILAKLTPSQVSGWIYLGVSNKSGRFVREQTTDANTTPTAGASIKALVDINLRDRPPTNGELGKVLGAVSGGSTISLLEAPKSIGLSNSVATVWANVSITSRPSPSVTSR
ncbi:MAG TPA: hypothetical protein VN934_05850 [Candidatus Tumulicola sp.]|nr:hypothetical protein [Candidatus Tumulicola sp.]